MLCSAWTVGQVKVTFYCFAHPVLWAGSWNSGVQKQVGLYRCLFFRLFVWFSIWNDALLKTGWIYSCQLALSGCLARRDRIKSVLCTITVTDLPQKTATNHSRSSVNLSYITNWIMLEFDPKWFCWKNKGQSHFLLYVYCLCLKSVWWLRLSGRDFPFTVHKGAELLFHLKQTLLYLDAFTQLSVFCYWSAVEGLVARCLKCFPGFFDVPVTGFSPSSPSPRENHFSATVPFIFLLLLWDAEWCFVGVRNF